MDRFKEALKTQVPARLKVAGKIIIVAVMLFILVLTCRLTYFHFSTPSMPGIVTYQVFGEPGENHVIYLAPANTPNRQVFHSSAWEITYAGSFTQSKGLFISAFQIPLHGQSRSNMTCRILINGKVWQENTDFGMCQVEMQH